MKLLFFDETSNNRDKQFFAICGVCIDSANYKRVAEVFREAFKNSGWQEECEFKGRFLFSESKGDPSVPVIKRIDLARSLIEANVAQRNARLKAVLVWNKKGPTTENYLNLLSSAAKRALGTRASSQQRDKNLCIAFCDRYEQANPRDIWQTLRNAVEDRGYVLAEDVAIAQKFTSMEAMVGLCYADLIAYLASWVALFRDVNKAQLSLFEELQLNEIQKQKYGVVKDILNAMKRLQILQI
jgi:hypothetical protein